MPVDLDPDDTTDSTRPSSETSVSEPLEPRIDDPSILRSWSSDFNYASRLQSQTRAHEDSTALIEEGGRSISFKELDRRLASFAGALRERRPPPGTSLLCLLPPGIDLMISILGALRAGQGAALLDPALNAGSASIALARANLMGMVAGPRGHLLRFSVPELRGLSLYLGTGILPLPYQALDRFTSRPTEPLAPSNPALVLCALDHKGAPDLRLLDHHDLERQQETVERHLDLHSQDTILSGNPLWILYALGAGATCVLPDCDPIRPQELNPSRLVRQLRAHRVTIIEGSPTFLAPIARHIHERGITLPSLEKLIVHGDRVPTRLLAQLNDALPRVKVRVVLDPDGYGPVSCVDASESLRLEGDRQGAGCCVGRPLDPFQAILMEPGTHRTLSTGQIGELAIQGSADSHSPSELDAPLRTGDIARIDLEGRIWLQGRIDEQAAMLLPWPVEGLAESIPFVKRACLLEHEGRSLLAAELHETLAPTDWRALLREATGVWQVVKSPSMPLIPGHVGRLDRAALRARLIEKGALEGMKNP